MKKWVLCLTLLSACSFTAKQNNLPRVNLVQLNCLAKNIYYEARGEPVEGKIAVAIVTLNRAKGNICKTVYAYKQFSWTLKKYNITEANAWLDANIIAYNTYITYDKNLFKATHFHTKQVKPEWRKSLTKIAEIGNHIFYK